MVITVVQNCSNHIVIISFLACLINAAGIGPHAPQGGITAEHTSFRRPKILESKKTPEIQATHGHPL